MKRRQIWQYVEQTIDTLVGTKMRGRPQVDRERVGDQIKGEFESKYDNNEQVTWGGGTKPAQELTPEEWDQWSRMVVSRRVANSFRDARRRPEQSGIDYEIPVPPQDVDVVERAREFAEVFRKKIAETFPRGSSEHEACERWLESDGELSMRSIGRDYWPKREQKACEVIGTMVSKTLDHLRSQGAKWVPDAQRTRSKKKPVHTKHQKQSRPEP